MKKTLKKKPIVYIAGPMTDIPHLNRRAFNEAESMLRCNGYHPINPVKFTEAVGYDFESTDIPYVIVEAIKSMELEAISACDAIYLLKGWEHSEGAKNELMKALSLSLRIMKQEGAF
jgi:hypothetical protein